MKIVWNGIDNYIESDQAVRRGHDFDGERLYHGTQVFTAFNAIEIDPKILPLDDDGETDFSGVLGTETGHYYKAE